MATNKQIRISITSALNAAGIEATKSQVDAMAQQVSKSMAGAAKSNRRHWADIKAAWDMGCSAIRTAWGAVQTMLKSAFQFETQTNQFKTLIGDIDEARAHMADLKALGDTPPFNLDQFAKASRSLMVMTDGALGYKKSLELIGDAAAATGHPIEEMGQAVGRLYAFIRDGQPLSRAVMQLRNMGVITPEVAQKLQDLQDAGKSNAEIWQEVEAALGRYRGAMAETEKTGDGLMAAMKSRWDSIVRAFGMAWADEAKGGMQTVLDKMKEIEEDGTLAVWAAKTGECVKTVADAFKSLAPVASGVWKTLVATFDAVGSEIGRFAGAISMGNFKDAFGGIGTETARAFTEAFDLDGVQKKKDEELKRSAAKKIAEKRQAEERSAEVRAAEEKKRRDESLAEGQKKIDERKAKEAAEKKAEEDKKAAEKAAKEKERLDKEEAARRERERQKELADRIRDHQKLLAAEREADGKARAAKAEAESKLQRAWGWYRDKESMAAQLEEEKAEAAAQKQYEKDFQRLRDRRRDWRTAENLSVDDEAVRRVALAREEKEQAERHLSEIEKNTADLADKIDELLQMKGG